eukprot:TRINITY_DN210_c3_g1_i1.p1 TRINITY_DN210_c3_g1~~TRINITY_DN210_c3_g1_i1.p1  ORF type:complete len:295 (+),score=84.40 TRINITY_DN210_c3_g1_i1:140-1024(+)
MLQQSGCVLLDAFGYFVQILLALFAFSSLWFKRSREVPQRPVKIWFFDVTKQGLGALLQHTSNVGISVLMGTRRGEQCVAYFNQLLLDTVVGVSITFLLLHAAFVLAKRVLFLRWILQNGNYGSPPSINKWLQQLCLWAFIVLVAKVVVMIITFWLMEPLMSIGDLLFAPLRPFPHIELVVVMVILPTIMNLVSFWITDNFLKAGGGGGGGRTSRSTRSQGYRLVKRRRWMQMRRRKRDEDEDDDDHDSDVDDSDDDDGVQDVDLDGGDSNSAVVMDVDDIIAEMDREFDVKSD